MWLSATTSRREKRGEDTRARILYEKSIASFLPTETDRVARRSLARLAKADSKIAPIRSSMQLGSGSHFSARTVGLHLEHNKSAVLVSSRQVVNSMRSDFAGYDRIGSQVHEVTPLWKQRQSLRVNGVGIEVLGLRHGGEEFHAVQNLGYVVHLGRWTLLHVGDADATEENLRSFNLQQEGIDVAFLPFWYLMTPEGQALVREHIRPKHIIAVHIPHASVSELHKATADIRAAFPDCTIFYTLMQKKQF